MASGMSDRAMELSEGTKVMSNAGMHAIERPQATGMPVSFLGVLIALLVLALAPGSAKAQQPGPFADTMIQWGDYDTFTIKGPRGVRACEEACSKDPRCRAWTFIKTVGQCRLKHDPGVAVANKCCVSGYKPEAAQTGGSKQDYCADYARRAVSASDANLQQNCGLEGPRWSEVYRDHYTYCLRVARSVSSDETTVREGEIARCTQSADTGRDSKCDHYVRLSLVQIATAAKGNCEIDPKDRRWSTDAKIHQRACERAPNSVPEREIAYREDQLTACFEKSGRREQVCTDYADSAIGQFTENLDNQCGFSGPRWNANKARHYQWCLDARDQDRKSETAARATMINTCIQEAQRRQQCDEYADTAVQAALRNVNRRCGLKGPGVRWSRYRDDHVEYCMAARQSAREAEEATRDRELRRCRGQAERDVACDTYAKRSTRISELAEENNCGFDGLEWSTDPLDHYEYCLATNYQVRQVQLQDKRQQLRSCSGSRGFTFELQF